MFLEEPGGAVPEESLWQAAAWAWPTEDLELWPAGIGLRGARPGPSRAALLSEATRVAPSAPRGASGDRGPGLLSCCRSCCCGERRPRPPVALRCAAWPIARGRGSGLSSERASSRSSVLMISSTSCSALANVCAEGRLSGETRLRPAAGSSSPGPRLRIWGQRSPPLLVLFTIGSAFVVGLPATPTGAFHSSLVCNREGAAATNGESAATGPAAAAGLRVGVVVTASFHAVSTGGLTTALWTTGDSGDRVGDPRSTVRGEGVLSCTGRATGVMAVAVVVDAPVGVAG